MSLRNIELDPPKRLAHLPLVMGVIRGTGAIDIIDAACGIDRRMKSSHGECVALILAGIFAGEHGLWRLQDRLDVYDMATVMRDRGIDLAEFHDVRLGRALDAVYRAGPDRIVTELALKMIEAHKVETDYLHFDTTTLTFYGAYEDEVDHLWSPGHEEHVDVEEVPATQVRHSNLISGDGREAPKVVRGYSKSRRHDLKQILYGSVVTRDGGVPLYGRAMDGNTSDITAATEFLDVLRKELPNPGKRCFVADSKGWNPRVLSQVHDFRLRILSRLPRSTRLSGTCLAEFDVDSAPCLLRAYDKKRNHWNYVAYQGSDAEYTFKRKRTTTDDNGAQKHVVETIVLPVRTVTCFSSKLYRQKLRTLDNIRKREARDHVKLIAEIERRRFRCRPDAQVEADRQMARRPWVSLDLQAEVVEKTVKAKRSRRGRPRKSDPEPEQHIEYRLRVTAAPADNEATDRRLRRAATYVLIRNRVNGWNIDDEEVAAAYSEQWRIEHGFSWLKSGAAINPAFLETDHRIEALVMIYHIALMTHALIQRNIRAGLKRRGWKLPYHRNKPSDNITAKFTYELFRNVTTQALRCEGQVDKRLFGIDEHTERAIRAIGLDSETYRPLLHDRENVAR